MSRSVRTRVGGGYAPREAGTALAAARSIPRYSRRVFEYASFWAALGLFVFFLAYRFYSRFVATRLFETDDDSPTPAVVLNDGCDYVPTNRHVLLGHHFTSIAGAAPIIGPAVACVHGWAPAVLWIVIGVVFIGAVHDFGALVVSVRNEGKSLGEIAGDLVGPRARTLFLCLIVILTWLVLAAFASAIASLFVSNPAAVVPINIEIPIALAMGWWYHKRKGGLLVPSLIALVLMWGSVFVTAPPDSALRVSLPPELLGFSSQQVWIAFLLVYSFVTCILPVWVLLQPRDFVNSHQLFVGLGALFLALFVSNPKLTAPAFNQHTPEAAGPIFPLLFVTVACGAVSGFHALVSSGTTSKQIRSLRDARAIGYGSMLGEGALALVTTLCVAAGFSAAEWSQRYGEGGVQGGKAIGAFVAGAANLLDGGLGFPHDVSTTIIAVVVISFAATTLDTACRIQRFCLAELGTSWNVGFLQRRYVGSAIAAFTPFVLCIQTHSAQVGADGVAKDVLDAPLWTFIWPVFGAANQMLGAIALLLITLYLKRRRKPLWYTGIPAVFLAGVTATGLFTLAREQVSLWGSGGFASVKLAVLVPAVLLLLLAIAVLWEGVRALRGARTS